MVGSAKAAMSQVGDVPLLKKLKLKPQGYLTLEREHVVSTETVFKVLFNHFSLYGSTSYLHPLYRERVPWLTKQRHSVQVLFQLPGTLRRRLLEGTRHNIFTIFGAWFIDSRCERRRNGVVVGRYRHTFHYSKNESRVVNLIM
jgi:hypothetical protein